MLLVVYIWIYLNVLCWSKVKWPFLPMFGIWQYLKWMFHYLLSPYGFQDFFFMRKIWFFGKIPTGEFGHKNMLMSRKILSINQIFKAIFSTKGALIIVRMFFGIPIWPHFLGRAAISLIPTPSHVPQKPWMILFLKKYLFFFWLRKD